MKSVTLKVLILLTISIFFGGDSVIAQTLAAQENGADLGVDRRETKKTIRKANTVYNVDIKYKTEEAVAGNQMVMKVIIRTPNLSERQTDLKNLKLVKCEWNDPSAGSIRVADSAESRLDEGLIETVYECEVSINPTTSPLIYRITLLLEHPDKEKYAGNENYVIPPVGFDMNVGVVTNGLLQVGQDTKQIVCLTGQPKDFPLFLENKFSYFTVGLKKIEIIEDPDDLIEKIEVEGNSGQVERKTILFDTPFKINPRQTSTIILKLWMRRMSLGGLVSGFSENQTIKLKFTYDDGHGRSISDLKHEVSVKMKPHPFSWVLLMFGGVIVGSSIRLYRHSPKIKKKQIISTIIFSVVVGVLVALIYHVGKIQVTAFGSSDHPMYILIIGVLSALGGYSILKKYLLGEPEQKT